MSEKSNGKPAKRPKRLPGRVYTLIVTGLAVVLIAIPLAHPQSQSWNTVAVVQHVPLEDSDSSSTVYRHLASAVQQVEVTTIPEVTIPAPEELRSQISVATDDDVSGEQLTTIQVRHPNRQLSADLAGVLAREFSNDASLGEHTAAVVSMESINESRIGRTSLLAIGAFAVFFGAITTIYPRPRGRTKSDQAEQLEQATGLPVLGSVFPSSGGKNTKRSSNIPLRLTVFSAELVVGLAFAFMLYTAATNSSYVSHLLGNPLETYAESVRSLWTGV